MHESEQTRLALQHISVHIVARARVAATGRFSLRVTPAGFGTPEFGPDGRRVRVAGGDLIVESDRPGASSTRRLPIGGSSLRTLAAFAEVDLTESLDVGHDTPDLGDVDAEIVVDAVAAADLAIWYRQVAAMLDGVVAGLAPTAEPTLARLWPEHFDVALDAAARPDCRVNLGGSPGDGFSAEPYLYVGPWTSDRPGDAAFWNAPFGAVRTQRELIGDVTDFGGSGKDSGDGSIVAAGVAFLLDGYRRLADPGNDAG